MKDLDVIFKALADVNRVRILKLLGRRRMCVCELAFVLGVSQPAVSKQLKKMVKAGLVDCEQDGFWTNYFISPKNLYAKKLLTILSQWLNDEKMIIDDLKKTEKANREKLCCKK
ncbi:MAG: metalloregulator ArsR/SmtB family transcription factor [Candidatus Kaelpia imicola]|nr:metalloregulator ArsR/SmtB family transcription factor [Candidatus Kaelpia imicola]